MNRSYLRWTFQRVAPIESQRWVGSGRKLHTSSSAVPGPACHIPPLKLVRSNLNSSKLTLFHIIFAYFKLVGLPKASRSGPQPEAEPQPTQAFGLRPHFALRSVIQRDGHPFNLN